MEGRRRPREMSGFSRGRHLLALLAAASTTIALVPPGDHQRAAGLELEPDPPSIVLILTDDQRWDTLWSMPNVQEHLVGHGISFSNGFVSNPLCCPSRASILTGNYSHSTGVYGNSGTYGGFAAFDDASTISTWLDPTHETALIGKYLNTYEGPYIPPGWDRFVAFSASRNAGGSYYNYELNVDGEIVQYGDSPTDYSTDVLAGEAEQFIRSTSGPLFLYFAPFAPHPGFIPAPRHAGTFSDLPLWRPPSHNEGDVSDKPAWLQAVPPMPQQKIKQIDKARLNGYRTLLAVDEAIGRIQTALLDTGRLDETMIVFASDNGAMWGEHRLSGKGVPYDEAIRIPFVLRYDQLIDEPRTDDHLVLNIDLAPTFAEAAGIAPPEVEGSSLFPLLLSPEANWRTDFLGEAKKRGKDVAAPTYCSIRSEEYAYVQYTTEEEELYEVVQDPHQLSNLASDPGYQSTLESLRTRLQELCSPPPPGFDRLEPQGSGLGGRVT